MPSSAFANTNFRKNFDGGLLYTLDDGVDATVYGFPYNAANHGSDDNDDYPSLSDNAGFIVNKVRGLHTGDYSQAGPLRADRGIAPFLTTAFGARVNGKISPWYATITEYAGGTAYSEAGLWFRQFQIAGAFGVNGRDAQMRYQLTGVCLDPNNTKGVTPSAPSAAVGGSGTQGAGISTFGNVIVDNNGGTPTVYDGIQAVSISGDNQITIDPAVGDTTNLLAAGMTPGQFVGGVALTQLKGAANPLPAVNGEYPIRIKIPTGDGTHTLTILLTASYNRKGQPLQPNDYNKSSVAYRTLGTAPGSSIQAMTFTYA